jgi:2,4-dienoyl-CoA reductase-like NADH-dependent reductase (Old Yellow Enzyme family)
MPQPLLFSPIALRDIALKNRVMVAPMHQYSRVRGFPTPWHLMNAGRFAAGGAGLAVVESTKVDRRFELVPPPYSYWLAKRAQSVPNIAPSTYRAGLGEPASPKRQA